MAACHMDPHDKKALISAVGENLVRRHGKRKYYQPAQVRAAAADRGYAPDYHCWAMCVFTTPEDFKALHEAAGEACDYAGMKAQVLAELAEGASFSWLDIDLSWLEWPDIDLSSLFGWFDVSP